MKSKKSHFGKTSDKITKIAIGALVVAMIAVAGYVAWQFYNMPEYATEREINSLAKDYYENYFYSELLNNNSGDESAAASALSIYRDKQMEPVKLRQLLLFDNGRHQNSSEVFNSTHYKCDTNVSTVRFQPVEPYGRTDYTYEVNLSCKEQ